LAWVEFHPTRIIKLKKFHDFRRDMGWSAGEALGNLGLFWGQTLEVQELGDITGWEADYLSSLLGFGAQVSERMLNALVSHGWVDVTPEGRKLIHDWLDYTGRFLRGKYSGNRRALEAIWAHHGRAYAVDATDKSPTSSRQVTDTTLPNPTEPNQTAGKALSAAFEELWSQYPSKTGRKAAERHFQASVKTTEDVEQIKRALANYLKSDRVMRGFVQNGSTWFNNWRDWINFTEPPRGGAHGNNGAAAAGAVAVPAGKYT
jgi:hypothetical protein